jgi:CRISPR-associated protein Cas2
MNRLWIIVYDIADDRRRRKVAGYLGSMAERVQESVFEAWLVRREVPGIIAGLSGLIDVTTDTVRVYPVSMASSSRRQALGQMPELAAETAFWQC